MTRQRPARPLAAALLAAIVLPAFAAPRFEEVTEAAGIAGSGPTSGVSWGDFDGDGWPDLWIGNHRFGAAAPTLLINRGDGSFADSSTAVSVDPDADLHGAAWADFDRDGDQDLIVLAGAGAGRGSSPNLLLRNDDGRFTDIAEASGLALPIGRGRTPVWLDADHDGRLDVLVVNKPRPDGQAPTTLFLQRGGRFVPAAPERAFAPDPRPWLEDVWYRATHGFSLLTDGFGSIDVAEALAQLTDVDGDRRIDLVAYGRPTRTWELAGPAPVEISGRILLGTERNVTDVATEDFDGDGRFDLYLVRARSGSSDVVLATPHVLKAAFRASSGEEPHALRFSTDAKVELLIVDPWEAGDRLPPVHIGHTRRQPGAPVFTLDPADPNVQGPVPRRDGVDEVLVHYDPPARSWAIENWGERPVHVEVRSPAPITGVTAAGFTVSKGGMADRLLLQRDEGFEPAPAHALGSPAPAACTSAAAGDYDNDMDVDVYLVCAEPVRNAPNVLLENIGGGRLRPVPDAGGAAGTPLGRGDSVATADYDRDGYLDLFVTNGGGSLPFSEDGPYQLFRNAGNGNHWLEIDLVGTESNREAIGAIVELTAGGVRQVRAQSGGMHSFSQNHTRLHFGLGANGTAERIVVWWPNGQRQELSDIPADRILTIAQDRGGS